MLQKFTKIKVTFEKRLFFIFCALQLMAVLFSVSVYMS